MLLCLGAVGWRWRRDRALLLVVILVSLVRIHRWQAGVGTTVSVMIVLQSGTAGWIATSKDRDGRPRGLSKSRAGWNERRLDPRQESELRRAIVRSSRRCVSHGVSGKLDVRCWVAQSVAGADREPKRRLARVTSRMVLFLIVGGVLLGASRHAGVVLY